MRSSKAGIIDFHTLDVSLRLNERDLLKQFIALIFKKENTALHSIKFIFCKDPYLKALNKKFLNHNYYTDVLSFAITGPSEPLEAEIYLSLDRIRENALKFKTTVQKEIYRVMFHGVLHLCGFKDDNPKNQLQMRQKEEYYLNMYLVPRGTK
ncbi:MAG: rRNA maturation RNase YbeY [Flavisolibacter sp.]